MTAACFAQKAQQKKFSTEHIYVKHYDSNAMCKPFKPKSKNEQW